MRKLIGIVCLSGLALCAQANDDCGEMVDMADSLDFHKMHVECANDPITIYDPSSSTGKDAKGVNVYEESSVKPAVATENISPQAEKNPGKIFNIREPFTVTGGPQSALNGLYAQMVKICPQGFEKNREWVLPAQHGYFLHFQFTCAD